MIFRTSQLFLAGGALALLTLSFLVVFRSPDWSLWQLALLAGEFGHWLAIIAVGLAVAAWISSGDQRVFGGAISLVSLLAAAAFSKPVLQAWLLSDRISESLSRMAGEEKDGQPFEFSQLLRGDPKPVVSRTLFYSGDLALDFYPSQRGVVSPCVIVIHGGGWDSGARGEFPRVNHWLANEGYAVAAISYRLAPTHPWPAQRDDIAAAIAFLKSRANELNIDPKKIVLFGRSAGGHLAEATAYTQRDPDVRGVIALYSPADVHFAWEFSRDDDVLKSPQLLKAFLGGTPETARAAYDSASPILFVDKKTPPTLLIHGRLDTLVWHRQSERLDQRLTEAGVPHVFISLPWATHAFDYNLNGPGGQITTYSVRRFLAAVTK